MVKFWRSLLKRTLPKDFLNGLKYAVLGLGDSGYAQFNYAAKRLNRETATRKFMLGRAIENLKDNEMLNPLGQAWQNGSASAT